MKEIWVVTTHVDGSGIVLLEVFDNIDDALEFEVNGVDRQLREHYGDRMADDSSLSTSFSTKILHEHESVSV